MKEEKTIPSKEDMIKWMDEQIEFKSKQVVLQRLDTQISVLRATQFEAMKKIAMLSISSDKHTHIVTKEDVDNNPDFLEQGINVGDEITFNRDEQSNPLSE